MLVMDQLPLPLAVLIPSTVTPSVSYKVTVLPTSAVPVSTGVVTLVMLSLDELPVSLAAASAGAAGVAGAVVSTVYVCV